jgi:hypothetical protein
VSLLLPTFNKKALFSGANCFSKINYFQVNYEPPAPSQLSFVSVNRTLLPQTEDAPCRGDKGSSCAADSSYNNYNLLFTNHQNNLSHIFYGTDIGCSIIAKTTEPSATEFRFAYHSFL